jgi:uncharacterized phage infection (PIP) family protein YhgE
MNRDQFNRTEMFSTVSAYMQTNTSLLSGTPAIGQTVNELNAKITAIAAKMSKQQTPITGAADQKAQVRTELEEKILEIADQLAAFAAAENDMNLGSQVELTLSSLDKMPDDALEETAQRVSTLATANLGELGDYGVIGADVTALDGLKTQFHNVKTTPRTAVAGRAAETSTLPGLITETTSLLRNRLDKQMTKYKKTQPEFYSGYRTARVIVDRGGAGGGTTPPPAPPTP